jgi:hypothetical protein
VDADNDHIMRMRIRISKNDNCIFNICILFSLLVYTCKDKKIESHIKIYIYIYIYIHVTSVSDQYILCVIQRLKGVLERLYLDVMVERS